MDVKALARSKRSHTKHQQPRKPHRPAVQSTTSSSSSSKDPKVLNKEGEKKRSNHGSSLPSNLDRNYDSDEEDGLFGSGSESFKTDVVVPKSKGADFGFLISEALSQSSANFAESFDSFCPDEYHFLQDWSSQGQGSMLSVLGENIFSCTGGDDFLMKDERPTNHELRFAHFLKILQTHSRRHFIAEDILPPEMRASQTNDRFSEVAFLIADIDLQEEEAELDNKMLRFEAKTTEAELDTLLDSFNEADFFDSSSNITSNVPSAATTNVFPDSKMENDIDDLLEETNAANSMAKQSSSDPSTDSKSLIMEDFDSWLHTLP